MELELGVSELEFRVGVGEWRVRSQESVRSSWSLELELESGIDILFIRIFNAETQRRRVRRGWEIATPVGPVPTISTLYTAK